MASIIACPRCSSHLQLPDFVDAAARGACPICRTEFPIHRAPVQALPAVELLPSPAEPLSPAPAETSARQEQVDRSTRLPANLPNASQVELSEPETTAPAAASSPDPGESSRVDHLTIDSLNVDTMKRSSVSEVREPEAADRSPATEDLDSDKAPSATNEPSHSGNRLDELLSNLMTPSQAPPVDLATPGDERFDPDGPQPTEFSPADFDPADLELTESRTTESDSPATFESPVNDLLEDEQPPLGVAADELESDGDASNDGRGDDPLISETGDDQLDWAAPADPRGRKARRLVGAAASCGVALLAIAYGAVWIAGARADFLNLAAGPRFLLPPSMRAETLQASGDAPADAGATENRDNSPRQPELTTDPAVQPAVAEVAAPHEHAVRWQLAQLRDPRLATGAELQQALTEAEAAADDFLRGDLSQQEAVGRKGRAYIQQCALAERLTLLDPAASDVTTERLYAKELLEDLASNETNRDSLAQIATRWLQFSERPSQGVLLVGRVADLNALGSNVQYALEVQYEGGSVVVQALLDDVKYSTGEVVGVVGVIIENPQATLVDYSGTAEQLILPGYTFDPDRAPERPSNSRLAPAELLLNNR